MGQAHQFAAALAASLRLATDDEVDFEEEERPDKRKPAPVGTTVEAGKFRRRVMKQRPLPTVTSAGYYICGPTGSPMSGPYAGPSEALAALTKQGGAMVQYKSAQSEDPDWAVSKPRPFPYGSNTVTGASVTTPQDYCESCRTPMTQGEIDRAYKDHGRMVCDSCSNAGTVDSKTAMPARTYRCESCRHTFNHRDQHAYCPNCNSFLVDKNASVNELPASASWDEYINSPWTCDRCGKHYDKPPAGGCACETNENGPHGYWTDASAHYDEDGNLLPPAYRLATVASEKDWEQGWNDDAGAAEDEIEPWERSSNDQFDYDQGREKRREWEGNL